MSDSPFRPEELRNIRALFPHTGNGHVYLNHAAISPLSLPVKSALDEFILQRHSGPVENYEYGMELMQQARGRLASYLSLDDPSGIAFLGNTSDGLSAVAKGFPWKAGDEIILNTHEFPSNVQPFRALEAHGVKLVFAEPDDFAITTEQLEPLINGNTRMISISAVQFLSGFRADLESIGELCKAHDLYFVVDAIQQLGTRPIDPQACHIDAIASGGHKWLMSPMGSGFLWISPRLSDHLTPAKTGWLSVEEPWELFNYNQPWKPMPAHLETGTPNMLGVAGMSASLHTLMETGTDLVSGHIEHLTIHLADRIENDPDLALRSPSDPNDRAGIVSFSCRKHDDSDAVTERLKQKNITISSREGMFRISPHFYNTTEELNRAVDELLSA